VMICLGKKLITFYSRFCSNEVQTWIMKLL
jgi:hypothetical protein